jgi:hypothetical protein
VPTGHLIEEKTRNVTLVNSFTHLSWPSFPSPGQKFTAFATLTDGLGDVDMALKVARLDTLEDIATRSWNIRFIDPLRQVRVLVRFSSLSFPAPGRYEFSLRAGGEDIAQCVLTIVQEEITDDDSTT